MPDLPFWIKFCSSMETRNNGFIRSRLLRMRIFGLPKGDQWSLLRRPLGRKPRTPCPYKSHTELTERTDISILTPLFFCEFCEFCVPLLIISHRTEGTESTEISIWHHPFLWVQWVLCALIRTRIRVIRAECGEETHSASPSTHWSPLNPGYPWSTNLFSSFSSFRPFSELLWCRMDFTRQRF